MSQAGKSNNSGLLTSVTVNGDVGSATTLAGVLNIVGGPGVQTVGDGLQTLTINVSTSGFTWNVVTSADNIINLTAENGYVTKGAGACIFLLPPAASVGDTFKILGYGNLWQVTQNANQSITLGIQTTTVGVGGSITATNIKDTVEIVCVTANLEFQINFAVGNITFA